MSDWSWVLWSRPARWLAVCTSFVCVFAWGIVVLVPIAGSVSWMLGNAALWLALFCASFVGSVFVYAILPAPLERPMPPPPEGVELRRLEERLSSALRNDVRPVGGRERT